MSNKYVKGLVFVVVGIVILVALLYLGDVIASAASGGESYGVSAQSPFGGGNLLQGWATWVIIGGVVLYLIYVLFADAEMFKIGTREVVMMAIGAALYGVLSWLFNIVPVPSVSLVALRPVVVIPIFFGFVFGPAVGFFVGAFGNVLGDALTGWGVFPIWDVANGLMGLIPGLAGLYLGKGVRGKVQTLLWVCVGVLAVAVILPLVSPNIIDPWSGEMSNFGAWWYVMLIVLVVMLGMSLAPRYWPYLLILLTLAFIAFGVVDLVNNGFSGGVVVVWAVAILCAVGAWYVQSKTDAITAWLSDDDTKALVVWGTLGVIVGIGFAAFADIFFNGYNFTTAFIGEFIPAAGPNILFAVILTPLLYAAWKQARVGAGR
ncbi:MAG: ECF transporter S component [Anaerolineae bacterium]|nr:ECF transporter S component [Anaerolineae bacterium]